MTHPIRGKIWENPHALFDQLDESAAGTRVRDAIDDAIDDAINDEVNTCGWSVHTRAHGVSSHDYREALEVIAAAQNITLDALRLRLTSGATNEDERSLFEVLALRRVMRVYLLAAGDTEETLPVGLRASGEALVAWARTFLAEKARQRVEHWRRYGEHDRWNRWNLDLFSAEENERIWTYVRAMEERDGETLWLPGATWNIVARMILTGETPGEDVSVAGWDAWSVAVDFNHYLESRWQVDRHTWWDARVSSELMLWAKQVMARHAKVTAVYQIDLQRAQDIAQLIGSSFTYYDPTHTVLVILMEAVTSLAEWQQGFDELATDTTLEHPLLDWYVMRWGGVQLESGDGRFAFISPTRGTFRYSMGMAHEGDDVVLLWPPRVRLWLPRVRLDQFGSPLR